jgi:phage shock protein PspC (stress-responsive transcriptional regulator)
MTDAPHTSPHAPHASNGPGGHDGREQLDRFFDWIRSSGVHRGQDRWLAGVCGAVARRTGLDPLIVRGIAIVVAILGGPLLFAYAVGWAFLPDSGGRIHAQQLIRGVFDPAMVAIIALFTLTFVPFARGLWWQGAPLGWGMPDWLETTLTVGWSIAVVIGLIWLVMFLARRRPGAGTGYQAGGYEGYGTAKAAGSAGHAGTTGNAHAAGFAGAGSAGTGSAGTAAADTARFARTTAGATYAAAGVDNAAPASVDPASPDAPTLPFRPAASASSATATGPGGADPLGTPGGYGGSWQEQNRAWREQRRAWQAAARHWHYHRHPGAGFTAIVLGIALSAGAVAAAVVTAVVSAGAWSAAAVVVGIAVTLGVLALGIIVSGIRGRDSGAMGGFAFLAVVALLVFGVFPTGTQFVPFGAPNWTVGSAAADEAPGYAVIAGQPTIDLTSLGEGDGFRTIDVWLGFGQTELILPTDRSVRVETNAVIGGVDYGDGSTADRGGMFFHGSRIIDSPSSNPAVQIRVWSLVGQVEIVPSNR